MPLLSESRLNHLGKLAFEWIYWHVLLPGRDMPGIGAQMRPAGKRLAAATHGKEHPMTTIDTSRHPGRARPEGFFVHPEQWTEAMAPEIARENGIAELTERHWQVIDFMRRAYLQNGTAPSIRTLGKASGVPIKELYQLFPKGPAKLAAKIAGIPKPRGCI